MGVTRATETETEADLEARARAALLKALPWLGAHQVEQQVTFTIRFGHATIEVNGNAKQYSTGRVDMLVTVDDVPTLVLELKRPGLQITDEDVEQGLSYARVLHPRPPLVLVTDGHATRLVVTQSGFEWTPVSKDGTALQELLENAALMAADDMKRAVSRLLGNDPTMWFKAARAVSASFVDERKGDWSRPDLPFVEGFLVERNAVASAISSLDGGERLILIEGGPLSGKSTALRELSAALNSSEKYAVMLLDADSGMDLFTTLADIWSSHFSWPLTPFEARHWTQQLSGSSGPVLVLALDDFDGTRGSFRRDLEALTSDLFGDRVRVVLAMDQGAARRLAMATNGRSPSTLKRRGLDTFTIGKLGDDEFDAAEAHIKAHGVLMMPGSRHTPELRLPWVLRAMCSGALSSARPSVKHHVVLASLPSPDLIAWVRRNPELDVERLARYRVVAEALLEDVLAGDRSVRARLDALEAYIVRRATLRERLAEAEVAELLEEGLLRAERTGDGEAVFVVQFPMSLASELAHVLANLIGADQEPEDLPELLTELAAGVPLGPVVVAVAINEAAAREGELDSKLFRALMLHVPRREHLPVGTRFALRLPDGSHFDLTVGLGKLEARFGAETMDIDLDEDGVGTTLADFEAWIILSHLATNRIEIASGDGSMTARFDVHLMLTIGSYPDLLLEVAGRDEPLAVETIDLPGGGTAISSSMGIVEPITYAIYLLFRRELNVATHFLETAVERRSLPLMVRIHTALRQLQTHSTDVARFNTEVVVPAIRELMSPPKTEE